MRLPRFRLRLLMVAVAVAGIAMSGVSMYRRSVAYRTRAKQYALWTKLHAVNISNFEYDRNINNINIRINASIAVPDREYEQLIGSYRRKLAHSTALRAKYERAARYPFLPVAPDPPPPE